MLLGQHPNVGKCQGAEMFKQRLLLLPTEKWRESIIMKNAFIFSCHSCFSSFLVKHCSEDVSVFVRQNKEAMCRIQQKQAKQEKNTSKIRKATPYTSSQNLFWVMRKVKLQASRRGAWWWLTSVGCSSLLRTITPSWSYPWVALSPSVLLGQSEEAFRHSAGCSRNFHQVCLMKLSSFVCLKCSSY